MNDPVQGWQDLLASEAYKRSSLTKKLTLHDAWSDGLPPASNQSDLDALNELVSQAKSDVIGRPTNPQVTAWDHWTNNITKGFVGIVSDAGRGVNFLGTKMANFAGAITGWDDARDLEPFDTTLARAMDEWDAAVQAAFPDNKELQDSFWNTTLMQGIGSMIGFVIPGGLFAKGAAKGSAIAAKTAAGKIPAIKLEKVGGGFISAATSQNLHKAEQTFRKAFGNPFVKGNRNREQAFMSMYGGLFGMGSQYDEAIMHNAYNNAGIAALSGYVIGTTESWSVNSILNRALKTDVTWAKHMLLGAAQEGAQEAAADVLYNTNAKLFYDENRDLFNHIGESAAVGAIIGGVMGFGTGMVQARKERMLKKLKAGQKEYINPALLSEQHTIDFMAAGQIAQEKEEKLKTEPENPEFQLTDTEKHLLKFWRGDNTSVKDAQNYASSLNITLMSTYDAELLAPFTQTLMADETQPVETAFGTFLNGTEIILKPELFEDPVANRQAIAAAAKYPLLNKAFASAAEYNKAVDSGFVRGSINLKRADETYNIISEQEKQLLTLFEEIELFAPQTRLGKKNPDHIRAITKVRRNPSWIVATEADLRKRGEQLSKFTEIKEDTPFWNKYYDPKTRKFAVRVDGANYSASGKILYTAGKVDALAEEGIEYIYNEIRKGASRSTGNYKGLGSPKFLRIITAGMKEWAGEQIVSLDLWLGERNPTTGAEMRSPEEKAAGQQLKRRLEKALDKPNGSAMAQLFADAVVFNAMGYDHNVYGSSYSWLLSTFSQPAVTGQYSSGFMVYENLRENLPGFEKLINKISSSLNAPYKARERAMVATPKGVFQVGSRAAFESLKGKSAPRPVPIYDPATGEQINKPQSQASQDQTAQTRAEAAQEQRKARDQEEKDAKQAEEDNESAIEDEEESADKEESALEDEEDLTVDEEALSEEDAELLPKAIDIVVALAEDSAIEIGEDEYISALQNDLNINYQAASRLYNILDEAGAFLEDNDLFVKAASWLEENPNLWEDGQSTVEAWEAHRSFAISQAIREETSTSTLSDLESGAAAEATEEYEDNKKERLRKERKESDTYKALGEFVESQEEHDALDAYLADENVVLTPWMRKNILQWYIEDVILAGETAPSTPPQTKTTTVTESVEPISSKEIELYADRIENFIQTWERTDGKLDERLDNFTLGIIQSELNITPQNAAAVMQQLRERGVILDSSDFETGANIVSKAWLASGQDVDPQTPIPPVDPKRLASLRMVYGPLRLNLRRKTQLELGDTFNRLLDDNVQYYEELASFEKEFDEVYDSTNELIEEQGYEYEQRLNELISQLENEADSDAREKLIADFRKMESEELAPLIKEAFDALGRIYEQTQREISKLNKQQKAQEQAENQQTTFTPEENQKSASDAQTSVGKRKPADPADDEGDIDLLGNTGRDADAPTPTEWKNDNGDVTEIDENDPLNQFSASAMARVLIGAAPGVNITEEITYYEPNLNQSADEGIANVKHAIAEAKNKYYDAVKPETSKRMVDAGELTPIYFGDDPLTKLINRAIKISGKKLKLPIERGAVNVKLVISGGQTGIDTLGIEIAKEMGIATGGTAPPGFAIQGGKNLKLRDVYGLKEISPELQKKAQIKKDFYLPRTEENAKNSDGTVYFATEKDQGGRYWTEKYARKYNKPFIVNPTATELTQWLADNNIRTLNVAGNRGTSTTPELTASTTKILKEALKTKRAKRIAKSKVAKEFHEYIDSRKGIELDEFVKNFEGVREGVKAQHVRNVLVGDMVSTPLYNQRLRSVLDQANASALTAHEEALRIQAGEKSNYKIKSYEIVSIPNQERTLAQLLYNNTNLLPINIRLDEKVVQEYKKLGGRLASDGYSIDNYDDSKYIYVGEKDSNEIEWSDLSGVTHKGNPWGNPFYQYYKTNINHYDPDVDGLAPSEIAEMNYLRGMDLARIYDAWLAGRQGYTLVDGTTGKLPAKAFTSQRNYVLNHIHYGALRGKYLIEAYGKASASHGMVLAKYSQRWVNRRRREGLKQYVTPEVSPITGEAVKVFSAGLENSYLITKPTTKNNKQWGFKLLINKALPVTVDVNTTMKQKRLLERGQIAIKVAIDQNAENILSRKPTSYLGLESFVPYKWSEGSWDLEYATIPTGPFMKSRTTKMVAGVEKQFVPSQETYRDPKMMMGVRKTGPTKAPISEKIEQTKLSPELKSPPPMSEVPGAVVDYGSVTSGPFSGAPTVSGSMHPVPMVVPSSLFSFTKNSADNYVFEVTNIEALSEVILENFFDSYARQEAVEAGAGVTHIPLPLRSIPGVAAANEAAKNALLDYVTGKDVQETDVELINQAKKIAPVAKMLRQNLGILNPVYDSDVRFNKDKADASEHRNPVIMSFDDVALIASGRSNIMAFLPDELDVENIHDYGRIDTIVTFKNLQRETRKYNHERQRNEFSVETEDQENPTKLYVRGKTPKDKRQLQEDLGYSSRRNIVVKFPKKETGAIYKSRSMQKVSTVGLEKDLKDNPTEWKRIAGLGYDYHVPVTHREDPKAGITDVKTNVREQAAQINAKIIKALRGKENAYNDFEKRYEGTETLKDPKLKTAALAADKSFNASRKEIRKLYRIKNNLQHQDRISSLDTDSSIWMGNPKDFTQITLQFGALGNGVELINMSNWLEKNDIAGVLDKYKKELLANDPYIPEEEFRERIANKITQEENNIALSLGFQKFSDLMTSNNKYARAFKGSGVYMLTVKPVGKMNMDSIQQQVNNMSAPTEETGSPHEIVDDLRQRVSRRTQTMMGRFVQPTDIDRIDAPPGVAPQSSSKILNKYFTNVEQFVAQMQLDVGVRTEPAYREIREKLTEEEARLFVDLIQEFESFNDTEKLIVQSFINNKQLVKLKGAEIEIGSVYEAESLISQIFPDATKDEVNDIFGEANVRKALRNAAIEHIEWRKKYVRLVDSLNLYEPDPLTPNDVKRRVTLDMLLHDSLRITSIGTVIGERRSFYNEHQTWSQPASATSDDAESDAFEVRQEDRGDISEGEFASQLERAMPEEMRERLAEEKYQEDTELGIVYDEATKSLLKYKQDIISELAIAEGREIDPLDDTDPIVNLVNNFPVDHASTYYFNLLAGLAADPTGPNFKDPFPYAKILQFGSSTGKHVIAERASDGYYLHTEYNNGKEVETIVVHPNFLEKRYGTDVIVLETIQTADTYDLISEKLTPEQQAAMYMEHYAHNAGLQTRQALFQMSMEQEYPNKLYTPPAVHTPKSIKAHSVEIAHATPDIESGEGSYNIIESIVAPKELEQRALEKGEGIDQLYDQVISIENDIDGLPVYENIENYAYHPGFDTFFMFQENVGWVPMTRAPGLDGHVYIDNAGAAPDASSRMFKQMNANATNVMRRKALMDNKSETPLPETEPEAFFNPDNIISGAISSRANYNPQQIVNDSFSAAAEFAKPGDIIRIDKEITSKDSKAIHKDSPNPIGRSLVLTRVGKQLTIGEAQYASVNAYMQQQFGKNWDKKITYEQFPELVKALTAKLTQTPQTLTALLENSNPKRWFSDAVYVKPGRSEGVGIRSNVIRGYMLALDNLIRNAIITETPNSFEWSWPKEFGGKNVLAIEKESNVIKWHNPNAVENNKAYQVIGDTQASAVQLPEQAIDTVSIAKDDTVIYTGIDPSSGPQMLDVSPNVLRTKKTTRPTTRVSFEKGLEWQTEETAEDEESAIEDDTPFQISGSGKVIPKQEAFMPKYLGDPNGDMRLVEGRLPLDASELLRKHWGIFSLNTIKANETARKWRKIIKANRGEHSEEAIREIITRYTEQTGATMGKAGEMNEAEVRQFVESREWLKNIVDDMRVEMEVMRKDINQHFYDTFDMKDDGEYIKYLNHYISHNYITKEQANDLVDQYAAKFKTSLRSAEERIIPTYYEAQTVHNLEPRTLDATKIYTQYAELNYRLAAKRAAFASAMEMTDEMGNPIAIERVAGQQQAPRLNTSPSALRRRFNKGETTRVYSQIDAPHISADGLYIHPDYVLAFKKMTYAPHENVFIDGIENFNQGLKRTWLAGSAFHIVALAESYVATVGISNIVNPKIYDPETDTFKSAGIKYAFRPIRAWKDALEENPELFKTAIDAGLTVGATHDVELDAFYKMIDRVHDSLDKFPALQKGIKGFTTVNQAWDGYLWDYLHTGMKMSAFFDVMQHVRNKGGKDADTFAKRAEIAKYINDAFGGQNWAQMAVDPTFERVLRNVMLAPDWTYSNLRIAGRPLIDPSFPPDIKDKHHQYWVKMISFQMAIAVAAQAALKNALAPDDDEMEMYAFNNPGDHTFGYVDVTPLVRKIGFIGKLAGADDDDIRRGTRFYTHSGKQFREVLRAGKDPLVYWGTKVSPAMTAMWGYVSGHSVTGWEHDFAKDKFWSSEGAVKRGKFVAELFLPFSLQGIAFDDPKAKATGSFLLSTPISREITEGGMRYIFNERLKKYIKGGEPVENLHELGVDLIDAGLRNGLLPHEITRALSGSAVSADAFTDWWSAIESGDTMKIYKAAAILQRLQKDKAAMVTSARNKYGKESDIYKILKEHETIPDISDFDL